MKNYKSFSFLALVFVVFIVSSIEGEARKTRLNKIFLQNHESDRTSAGLWVKDNTPEHFRLLTFYGNPAFFSKRYTYDGSNLNAKYEPDHIIKRPEIIIMENANKSASSVPGSNELVLHNHPSKEDYEVVKTFFKTWRNGMNFYITVMARKDVLSQITNKSIKPPLLINYVDYRFTSPSDSLAAVGAKGVWGLRIHGPAEGLIVLKADPCKMLRETNSSADSAVIKFSVDEKVLKYLKGGLTQKPRASLGLTYRVGNKLFPRRVVDYHNPRELKVDCNANVQGVEISIDNNQSSAYDWLEASVNPGK